MLDKKNIIQDKEAAIIVGVVQKEQTEQQVKDYLDELAFLAETAGAETKKDSFKNYSIQIPALLWEKVNWKKYASMLSPITSSW
ncbi:hypothetical protein [Niabella ginsengisoli]|uniref:Uncharacterized protein n=1 Tax=Niabella ginsengisoli TaxID=522298 RepID=A0ABS9SN25_9BACT|nr:hypothetical protein [Niabella ginsengisoli]MCH5599554.1 hypothetical protein [Niabella ginsengisoli]